MGAMGFGERFAFALKSHNVSTRGWNRLGRNDRLKFVLRVETRGQWLPVQHDLVEWPHASLAAYPQSGGTGAFDEKERRYLEVQLQALVRIEGRNRILVFFDRDID